MESFFRNSLGICPFSGTFLIPGMADPLWPAKLKMVIFGCFWNFGQLKSLQMGKSEIAKLKAYRLAFQRYQIYQDLTGLRWIMAQEVVKGPKTLH